MSHKDQEFVEMVVKAIVANPNAVSTVRTVDERGVLITLTVDPSDMGYVIGRQGSTAQSLRTLLRIVGAQNNARVNLKIYEPNKEEGSQKSSPEASQEESPANVDVDLNI